MGKLKLKGLVLAVSIAMANMSYASTNDKSYNLVFDAIKLGSAERLENVLKADKGAINNKDKDGKTPIFYAIDKQGGVVDVIINNIESVSLTDTYKGLNPLNYAIKNRKYNTIVKLLNTGVNPTIKDDFGKTAFHYALDGDENIVKIFKQYAYNNPDIAESFANSNSKDGTTFESMARVDDTPSALASSSSYEPRGGYGEESLKDIISENLYNKFKRDYKQELYLEVKNEFENSLRARIEGEYKSEFNRLNLANQDISDLLVRTQRENKRRNDTIADLSSKIVELDDINKEQANKIRELNGNQIEKSGKLSKFEEEIAKLKEENKEKDGKLNESYDRIANIEKANNELTKEKETVSNELKAANESLASVKKLQGETEAKLNEVKANLEEQLAAVKNFEKEKASLDVKFKANGELLANIQKESKEKDNKIKELLALNKDLKKTDSDIKRVGEINKLNEKLVAENKQLVEDVKQVKKIVDLKQAEINRMYRVFSDLTGVDEEIVRKIVNKK